MASQFDTVLYPNIGQAWGNAHLSDSVLPLDSTLLFTCNPVSFTRLTGGWWDTETIQYYNVPGAVNDDDICGPDIKTRLAVHRGQPWHFIMILCPPVLGQVEGQPKMFVDLSETDLSHNTRPSEYFPPPLTSGMTLNMLLWEGMSIDQLRTRVLSVYIGRTILLVTGAIYADDLGIFGRFHSSIITMKIVNHLTCIVVQSSPSSQKFSSCITLPLNRAIRNVDTLSMYMTGR